MKPAVCKLLLCLALALCGLDAPAQGHAPGVKVISIGG